MRKSGRSSGCVFAPAFVKHSVVVREACRALVYIVPSFHTSESVAVTKVQSANSKPRRKATHKATVLNARRFARRCAPRSSWYGRPSSRRPMPLPLFSMRLLNLRVHVLAFRCRVFWKERSPYSKIPPSDMTLNAESWLLPSPKRRHFLYSKFLQHEGLFYSRGAPQLQTLLDQLATGSSPSSTKFARKSKTADNFGACSGDRLLLVYCSKLYTPRQKGCNKYPKVKCESS